MSFVFVSHTAHDKPRIRPLIEALTIHHSMTFWLDRPGHGESHFGFDRDFIEKYGIIGIKSGEDYRLAILEATSECAAVLACFSRQWSSERRVLHQELILAQQQKKLVACVVDDIPFGELPADLGLADASTMQAARINADALRQALIHLATPGALPALLPPQLFKEWEIVNGLARSIEQMLESSGNFLVSSRRIAEAKVALLKVPEYPAVRPRDIPHELASLLSSRFDSPDKARKFLSFAMQLRSQCNPDGHTDREIIVGSGEVLNPDSVASDEFWDSVMGLAGAKSRRTLAALLLAPGGLTSTVMRQEHSDRVFEFLIWLEHPAAST
jgi:hypothetical protein